jgi:hypothetical protein
VPGIRRKCIHAVYTRSLIPKRLAHLTVADLPRVGGKAFNCARLLQAGFPVPDGLAIASDATDADVLTLPDHPWLGAVPQGERFAVRSSGIGEDSAGHSFAGIHETRLNVERGELVGARRGTFPKAGHGSACSCR